MVWKAEEEKETDAMKEKYLSRILGAFHSQQLSEQSDMKAVFFISTFVLRLMKRFNVPTELATVSPVIR